MHSMCVAVPRALLLLPGWKCLLAPEGFPEPGAGLTRLLLAAELQAHPPAPGNRRW